MSPLPPSQRIYQASFCFPARAEKRVHLSENCSPLPPPLPFLIVTVHSPCTMIRTLSPTTNGYCTPLNALGLSASSPSSILSCYMLKEKKISQNNITCTTEACYKNCVPCYFHFAFGHPYAQSLLSCAFEGPHCERASYRLPSSPR